MMADARVKKPKLAAEVEPTTEALAVEKSRLALEPYTPGAIASSLAREPGKPRAKKAKKAKAENDDDALFKVAPPAVVAPVEEQTPAAAAAESLADTDKDKRTVFVGNVPTRWKVDEGEERRQSKLKKDLTRHFAQWGAVESVRTRSIALESVKVPPGSDAKRVRKVAAAKASLDDRFQACNAYVVFKDAQGAEAALQGADGSEFHGNHLRVDSLRKTGGKVFDRSRTAFVGNLAFEAGEEEVRRHFDALGVEVESVRVVRDSSTNIGKGFAYVLLAEGRTVDEAIALGNGTEIRERKLRVGPCERSQSSAKFKSKHERAKFFQSSVARPPKKTKRRYGVAKAS